jgi:hypothetical protein
MATSGEFPVAAVSLTARPVRVQQTPVLGGCGRARSAPLALLAAEALSTLLSLARELARILVDENQAVPRRDRQRPGSSSSRSETISHGVKSFGPIVIHVPTSCAIVALSVGETSASAAGRAELRDADPGRGYLRTSRGSSTSTISRTTATEFGPRGCRPFSGRASAIGKPELASLNQEAVGRVVLGPASTRRS